METPSPLEVRRILPVDLARLRDLQRAIEQQQTVLDGLIYARDRQIETGYGVDLSKESWDLDLDEGTLTKTDGSKDI